MDNFTKPKYMSYAITWKCNSRCKQCSIWNSKRENTEEITLEQIGEIFSDSALNSLEEVILTGGEPSLREDITQLAEIITRKTNAGVGITTNGLLPDKVYNFVVDLTKKGIFPGVFISLDGPERVHDKIRGIKGNYKKVMYLIEKLIKFNNETGANIIIRTGLTATEQNIPYIQETKDMCDFLGIIFGVRLAENSGLFNNQNAIILYSKSQIAELTNVLEATKSEDIKEYYTFLIDFLNGKNPRFECTVKNKYSYMMTPDGLLYPCPKVLHDKKFLLGDLKKEKFSSILTNKKTTEAMKNLEGCYGCLNAVEYNWSNNLRAT